MGSGEMAQPITVRLTTQNINGQIQFFSFFVCGEKGIEPMAFYRFVFGNFLFLLLLVYELVCIYVHCVCTMP